MAPRTESHFLLTVVFPAPWALVEERGLYRHHHRIHYTQEKILYCSIVYKLYIMQIQTALKLTNQAINTNSTFVAQVEWVACNMAQVCLNHSQK